MRLLLAAALAFAPAVAQTNALTVVSAANFGPVVAPESFVGIFGQQLSTGTQAATLDSQGALPLELLGTVVEFEGVRAGLHFVSPGQINCVVPSGAPSGAVEVLVRNTSAGTTVRGTVRIARAAPALFSAGANGQGAGAILNGVTFAAAPFLVETLDNPGPDKRTRLAVYGTGFRNAGPAAPVQAQARTPGGELFPLVVEFAGAAPVYPGLDQANLLLPAEADVDGEMELTLKSGTTASNTVTVAMEAIPASRLRAAGVEMSRGTARPGESLTATVQLNGRAPRAGAQIRLSSDELSVRVPQVATVPSGAVSEAFNVQIGPAIGNRQATVTAEYQGSSASAPLLVLPADAPRLAALSLARNSVIAGSAAVATVRLSAAAPLSGQLVSLLSSHPFAARVPAQVSVPFGRTEAQVEILTAPVRSTQDVTIAASLAEDRREASLQVRAPLSVTWLPESVVGGTPVRLSVSLGEPSPAGAIVSIVTDDPSVPVLPTISVSRGQDAAAINVTTPVVQAARTVTATASSLGLSATAELTLAPRVAAGVESVALNPEIVRGGAPVNGVVRISQPAPVGGAVVNLSADDAFAVRLPGFVVIPAGATSAAFSVRTFAVSATRRVGIAATWAGVRKSAVLTVN